MAYRRYFDYQTPIAFAMLNLIDNLPDPPDSPFTRFSCCWIAFNALYSLNGPQPARLIDGAGNQLTHQVAARLIDGAGNQLTHQVGHVANMARVTRVTEKDQLIDIKASLPLDLIHDLITHRAMRFFATRKPIYQGQRLRRDDFNQRPNGVLHVAKTLHPDFPVWAPINTADYSVYIGGNHDPIIARRLAVQIVDVLYAVRNNTFHGSKNPDDSKNVRVLNHGYDLLRMIVDRFVCR